MKLTTAPTLGFSRRIAAISAPMSKSPVCTRTVTSLSCSANSWGNSGTLKAGPIICLTAIHHRSENPRNRRQARRESSTVAGAGGTWSRDRRRAEEGPRTFSVRGSDLGGDRGRRAIPCASDLGSHPQIKLGPLLRLDSRPRLRGCDRATGQYRVDHRPYACLRGQIPEGALLPRCDTHGEDS